MPWNAGYPASMKNLPPAVRERAIEIANALLEAGKRGDTHCHRTGAPVGRAASRRTLTGQMRRLNRQR